MTPILYEKDEIDFTSQGLGALAEIYDVDVAEQRNGLFQLTANYPVTGIRYDDISVGRIILAKPNQRDEPHAFRIVNTELDVMGYSLMIEADSITYDLNHNFIKHLTVNDATGQVMMSAIQSAIVNSSIFTFYSDINHKSSTKLDYVNPMEAVMGVQGSFLQYWGGELKRENRRVAMFNRRGRDNVATFRLGKNISGLKHKVDISSLVTRIVPVKSVQENDKTTYLEGTPVSSKYINNYEQIYTIKVDFTDESIKTVDDLNKAAEGWFVDSANTGRDKPSVTIDIDVLSLQDSADYQDKFKNLESVALTDTVTVYVPEYGVNVTAIVNEIHFDPIQERVTKLVVGTAKQSFADSSRVQLSDLQGKIISVQEQADQIAVSANGKNSNYYGSVAPSHPQEGDLWYWVNGDLSGIKQFVNGDWADLVDSNTQQQITDSVNQAVLDAQNYSDQLVADNRAEIDSTLADVQEKQATLEIGQAALDTKAQGYADKALADARADVAQAVQELVATIGQETEDRTAAVTALDTKAKEYAANAKTEAVSAATQALNDAKAILSGDITKETSDRAAAIVELENKTNVAINQAKSDAQSAVRALKIGGRNLVVTEKLVRGWMSAGDIGVSSAHGMVTDFISVEPNSNLVAQIWYDKAIDTSDNYFRVAFFDANKDYITRTPLAGSDSTTYNKWIINTPENTAFIRVSFDWLGDGYGHAKIEKGNKATDYTQAPEDVVLDYTTKDNVIKQSLTQYQEANDGRVTKAQSDITQALGELATKVSQTTFNTKTSDLETKYTNVKQTADKATTDIVEIKKTDTTQDSKINSVQSDVNSTKQSISAIQTTQNSQTQKINEIVTDVNGTKQSITDIQTKDGQQDTRMGTIETSVSGISSSFSAYKTTNDGKVSTAQSTATQALNEVATKVSKTDYDKKTGQLQTDLNTTTATANQAKTDIVAIKQKNDSQDARMTSIESDANGTKTTVSALQTTQGQQSGAISSLQQRADGFEATVDKVNNISVGGRNLLLNSKSLWWVGSNNQVMVTTEDFDATTKMWHLTSPQSGWSNVGIYFYQPDNTSYQLVKGDKWAFSFDIKGEGAFQTYGSENSADYSGPTGDVPSVWKRVFATGKAGATNAIILYFETRDKPLDVYIKLPKLELGNIPTQWTPAPEDQESAISQARADIRANATAIMTKVSQSDYNTKTGQIEGKISLIEQTATGINQSVTNVQNQVNGLSVGGRNLFASSKAIPMRGGINGDSSVTVTLETFDNTTTMWHIVSPQNNGTGVGIYLFDYAKDLLPDKASWSYSADIKGTGAVKSFGIEAGSKNPIVGTIGSDWSRISQTGKLDSGTRKTIIMYFDTNASPLDVYIKLPKLELGNMPTDWSPAPEDTDNKISTVSQTVDGISSIVSDPTTGLTTRVQTAEGNISTVQSNVSGLQSQQTQTAKGLTTEISDRQTGDTNTLTQAKDFTTSSINSSESGLRSQITQTSNAILANIGAVNLFPNSEFEKDYGWRSKNGTVTLSLTNKDLVDGKYSGTVKVVSTAAGWQGYWARNIAVVGGQRYSISTLVHYTDGSVTGGFAQLDVYFIDKDGTRIGGSYGDTGAIVRTPQVASPYWVKLYREGMTAPVNAVNLQVSLLVNNKGAGQTAVFTQPMVTATEKLQPYTPNNDITTQLSLFKDNWSIGLADNIGNIASGIAGNSNSMTLISNKVVINSPSTQITGTAWIKSAMIADGQIGTAKIGDAAVTSAKISSLDVNKLTGNVSNFIQSNWNGKFASTTIDNSGMSITAGSTVTKFDSNGARYTNNSGINATYSFGKWSDSNGNATSSTGLYLGATGSDNSFINILGTDGAAALVLAGSTMDYGSNLNIMQGTLNSFVNINVRSQLHFKGNRYNSPAYIEINENTRTFNFFTGGGSQGGGNYFWFNQNVLSAGTFSSTSTLSKKNVKSVYDEDALGEIAKTQLVNFEYKNRPGQNHVSPIIDDVNKEKKYYIPKTILGQDGQYVDMYTMISMAWRAIQQLNDKIEDK